MALPDPEYQEVSCRSSVNIWLSSLVGLLDESVRPLLLLSHIHTKTHSCSLSVVYFTLVLHMRLSSELRAQSCFFMWQLASDFPLLATTGLQRVETHAPFPVTSASRFFPLRGTIGFFHTDLGSTQRSRMSILNPASMRSSSDSTGEGWISGGPTEIPCSGFSCNSRPTSGISLVEAVLVFKGLLTPNFFLKP